MLFGMVKRKVIQSSILLSSFIFLLIVLHFLHFGTLTGFALYKPAEFSLEDFTSNYDGVDLDLKIEAGKFFIKSGRDFEGKMEVANEGNMYLRNCLIYFYGENEQWFGSQDKFSLGIGESVRFNFMAQIPSDVTSQDFVQDFLISCDEGMHRESFEYQVYGDSFVFDIEKIEETRTGYTVYYWVRNFVSEERVAEVEYYFENSKGEIISSGNEKIVISQGEKKLVLEVKVRGASRFGMIIDDGLQSERSVKEIGKFGSLVTGSTVEGAENYESKGLGKGMFFVFGLFLAVFLARFVYGLLFPRKREISYGRHLIDLKL